MKMCPKSPHVSLLAILALSLSASADYGLKTVPGWRARPAKKFTVDGGVIRADGELFPLIMDFTWSAPHDDAFMRYDAQLLGTAHYFQAGLNVARRPSWGTVDRLLGICARNRVYYCAGLSVANQDGYAQRHPEAAMMGPKGGKVHRRYACLLDPGYRKALGKALADLGRHCRNKPYFFGYYTQDEFSYPGMGGYNPTSIKVFRERIVKKYGGLSKLNAAWKTNYATPGAIQPPLKMEATVRWADWQEFRRWAFFDFSRFVYQTLKKHDPNHLVVVSLDFWGSYYTVTNWWRMSQCADVLMRHGIGYGGGNFRFQLVREIAEWSGRPGSALAMPPSYYAPYEKFSLLLDVSRTGISYVCAGGGDEHTYYRGAADSNHGYKRRDPGYTTARSANQLIDQLGPTYLLSKRRAPQVGFFVSDRTVWIGGVDRNHVNGILCLLGDLNLDFQIVSEQNFGDLSRFKTLIAGPGIRAASDESVGKIEAFVRAGGGLVLMPGAFERDANNVPVARTALNFYTGKPVRLREVRVGKVNVPLGNRTRMRALSKAIKGAVLARTTSGAPAAEKVKLGRGEVLVLAWDAGPPYRAAWTKDFTGVGEKENVDAIEDNAYANMRPERVADGAVDLLPQRAVAVLLRDFARAHGARQSVRCEGYADAVAALRARSLKQGSDYLVGIANRMVKPGKKFADTWPSDYHVPLKDLVVDVALDAPAKSLTGVVMPLARPSGKGWRAMPQLVKVQASRREGRPVARFTLPKVDAAAMVVVSPDYHPVLGAATDRRSVIPGGSVKLTGRILNPGTRPVRGRLHAEGDPDGLVTPTDTKPFQVAPGGSAEASFTLKVPRAAKPGYYLTQVVARLSDGRVFRSPSLEVETLPIFTLAVSPEDQTIYPDSPVGKELTVSVRPNSRGVRGSVSLTFDGAPSLRPDTRRKTLRIDGSRETYQSTIRFRVPREAHITETATLTVAGTVGGVPVKLTRPVRLARGVVAYREKRKARATNSRPDEDMMDVVVLENRHLKTHIIPRTGVIHTLILRDTNNDMLKEGTYPFGLVWYAWRRGWRLKELTPCGTEVKAVLASKAPDGKPVTLTASLREGDRWLRVEYDASAAGPVAQSFYLMSMLGRGGTHTKNTMRIPTKRGMVKRLWRKHRGFRTFPVASLAEPWLAVVDPVNEQVFSVSFDFKALKQVKVSSGAASFNYMVFAPDPKQRPGRIVFRLAAQKGGLGEARDLQRSLIRAGR